MPHPILITRAADQADAFAARLRAALPGARILVSPVLAIQPLAAEIPRFDTALLTSSQALRALPAGFDPGGRPAICVGQKTTDAACTRGFRATFGGQTVDALIGSIINDPQPSRYLHLRGRHSTGQLKDRLLSQGLTVADCILYDQIAKPLNGDALSMLGRETPVVLPLFSPRSARLLSDQIMITPALIAVCISQNVADLCAEAGFSRIRVAPAPTGDDMMTKTVDAAVRG